MKKVGIILGIFFIALAIFIFIFVNRGNADKPQVDNNTNVVDVQNNNEDKRPIQGNTENSDVGTEPIVTPEPEVIEKIITKEISSVKTISESSLSKPSDVKDVIAVISNKRILLIDEDAEGTTGKMLTYCFDVLTPDNEPLIVFVTKSVYTEYSVGDKLAVTYLTYKNDLNIEFPIILSVSAVE